MVIFSFSPNYFSKYKLELKEQEYIGRWRVYFVDLDNDGISEKFRGSIAGGTDEETNFILWDDKDDLIDQWTFLMDLVSVRSSFWFFDLDNNGFKEVYFVSHRNDSALLNRVEPLSNNGINHYANQVFIDSTLKYDDRVVFGTDGALLSEYKSGEVKELFFALTSGYAGYPRNAYKYNPKNGKVTKSKYLVNGSKLTHIMDIDGDGFDEILLGSFSHGNDVVAKYSSRSDYSLWLNVLDHNLNFLFEPVEIKVPFSELLTLPYKNKGRVEILAHLHSKQKETSKSKLLVYSNSGELMREKELKEGIHKVFLNPKEDGFLVFNTTKGELKKFTLDLEELSSVALPPFSEWYGIDINTDGTKEWLRVSIDKSKFSIYPENFKDPVSFKMENSDDGRLFYGIKKTVEGDQFYLQRGSFCYLFSYGENKYYYLNFLTMPGIYLVILGLVLLIIKGHKIKTEKQRAIEIQISELQIKTIKNQVDPHFVFNAINTISEMMLTDNKLEADNFICRFSDLMRGTLQNSDKIICSLHEEIEYTENFIQLQQIRFNNKFDYQLTLDKTVDVNEQVPKHVLYSYVENAIKHGLATKDNGLLKIEISSRKNKLVLVIEDNGGGRDTSKPTKRNSTGNGLKIMEKVYELFAKLYKKAITCHVDDIVGDEAHGKGVRVTVLIDK